MRLVLLLLCGLLAAVSAQDARNNTISVTGSSTKSVVADTVMISLTIQTTEDKSEDACAVVSDAVNSVTAAINKDVGAAEVSTAGLSIYQNITYGPDNKQTVNGFVCSNSLSVKLVSRNSTELGLDAGAVIDAAMKAGSNLLSVGGMTASLSPELQASSTNEARTTAVKDAANIAKTLAAAADLTLGSIRSIADTNVAPTPVPMAAAAAPMADSAAGSAPTPVTIGKQDVTATVAIVYDFTA